MSKFINLRGVSHSFGIKNLFENLNIRFSNQEKLCIVGENGTGKSTLLKIIAGQIEANDGVIEKGGHLRVNYITQDFDQSYLDNTIEDYINSNAGPAFFKKIFNYAKLIGYDIEKNLGKKCRELSGGQQKVLMISTGIALSPDFLLLDEPENHLDIVSRFELIKILNDYRGGLIFISHDRFFIDAIADKVAELANRQIFVSEGTYQDYIDARLSRIEGMQKEFDGEMKRIRQLEKMMPILLQKAFRGKETSAYQRHKKELDDLRKKHKDNPRAKDTKTRINLQRSEGGFHNGRLLGKIDKVSFSFSENVNPIFKNVNLEIRSGNHIVLLGRNGSGKSTFLKILTGKISPKTGSAEWKPDVKVNYFDQHAEFDPEKTALEIVSDILKSDDLAMTLLGSLKFKKEKMETKIKNLSGGERMRVNFASAFAGNPDFLILDEPTNNLDEVTWQILLDTCNRTKSTILLVTHDYEFIEGLDNKTFWVINHKTIVERNKELEDLIEELKT